MTFWTLYGTIILVLMGVKMEEEILKLLFDYSIKGKTSDMAYIDKLVEILVDGLELQNEVNILEKRRR